MKTDRLNAKTFEQLFNDKYEQLYYFAYDYVVDGETAKDIVSEVFANVWNNRESIVLDNINSYLHISVRNKCLDYLNTTKRLINYDVLKAERLPDNDDEWERREAYLSLLQEEIRLLPARTQWMLKEKYYNGRSYKELSEMLGITTEGIKKLVTRTYNELRDRLNAKKVE